MFKSLIATVVLGFVTALGLSVGCSAETPQGKGKPKVKFVKVSELRKGAAPIKLKAGANPGDFSLVVATNDDVTVNGTDAAGDVIDISGVAKVVATSSDATIVTIGPALVGTGPANYNEKALKVGTATITVVATWNDPAAGIGPFTFTYTDTVTAGPATGLIITHGVPQAN